MSYQKVGLIIGEESTDDLLVGVSKIGGKPSMPADYAWPVNHISDEPLGFVFQINFEELQKSVPNEALPAKGLFQFYCSLNETDLSGEAPEHAFVFFTDTDDLTIATFPTGIDEGEADLSERQITFTTEDTEGAYILGDMPEFNLGELNDAFDAESHACLMELDAYEYVSRKGTTHQSVFGSSFFTFPIEKKDLESGNLDKAYFVREG